MTLSWLVARLHAIGWTAVWQARPTAPAFYLLSIAAYFVLPVADTLIYHRLWGTGVFHALPTFLRKRIYNSVVVGYSGEVALLVWARRRLGLSDAAIAHAIKDVNILSAVVSALAGAGLAVWLVGHIQVGDAARREMAWWAAATVAMAMLLPAALALRSQLLAMDGHDVRAVLSIHAIRFITGLALTLAAWSVALPGTPPEALVSLLALQVLVNRIPFVPSGDVLFAGVALAVSRNLALAESPLAGVLLTTSALTQLLHLVVFSVTGLARESRR